jgi:hypothetical protein
MSPVKVRLLEPNPHWEDMSSPGLLLLRPSSPMSTRLSLVQGVCGRDFTSMKLAWEVFDFMRKQGRAKHRHRNEADRRRQ